MELRMTVVPIQCHDHKQPGILGVWSHWVAANLVWHGVPVTLDNMVQVSKTLHLAAHVSPRTINHSEL